MLVAIYSDNHFCKYSSIVRKNTDRFTLRLENQIKTLQWVEDTATQEGCSQIICGGDFFNDPFIDAQEITALKEINFNPDIEHIYIAGNHEMGMHNNSFSSCNILSLIPNNKVYTQPEDCGGYFVLPYILENDRQPLNNYLKSHHKVIISHNDIAGIQMGKFISTAGFSIEEIEDNCDLFINGHIHNGQEITNKIINIGNITGQNFSEDANKYSHHLIILDTDTLQYRYIDNPYAFNFYKFDSYVDITKELLKDNAVISIKCPLDKVNNVKELLNSYPNVIEYRVLTELNDVKEVEEDEYDLSLNHLEEFINYCVDKLGDSDLVKNELNEVCK